VDIFRALVPENPPGWAEIGRCLDSFRIGVRERPPSVLGIWRDVDDFRGDWHKAVPWMDEIRPIPAVFRARVRVLAPIVEHFHQSRD
jgi:hypothetical protein